jgi:hypothetical protein
MIEPWIPAFAGMTEKTAGIGVRITEKAVGMTKSNRQARRLSYE